MTTFAFKFKSVGTTELAPLFMDFMAHHAHAQGLSYATTSEVFYLKAPLEQAKSFATQLSLRLPLALSFNFLGVEVAQEPLEWHSQEVPCPPIDISQAKDFLDPTHKDFCAPKVHFFSLSYQNQELTTPTQVQEAMQSAVQTLQTGQNLVVKTSRGVVTLSPTPKKDASVLFMDLASVLSVTRLDHKSAQVLCAFEKPTIRATLKEVFSQEFQRLEIDALLPYDLGLALLGHFLLEKDISYLFLTQSPESVPDFAYTPKAPSTQAQTFSVAQNGLLLAHKRTRAKNTLDFIRQEAPKEPHLLIYLNFERPSCFWVYQEGYKQLLSVEQETHPQALLAQLQSNAKGRKLYANYKQAFPDLCQALEQAPQTPPSQNLLDFLAGLVQVLGFSQTHNPHTIFELATSFLRNKGPRVDFKLTKEPLSLNPTPTLRSAASYTLGGTDAPTMCFGILDSLAEFLGNVIYDAHTKFSCDRVYLCGEVFLQKVFLDLCLQYFPKECPPTFPTKAMDYQDVGA
ncbi:protein hydE [Helicobacter ailurogastricus]|uniref:protein hydE n=1 Tax=Helicobacter ailurogastricus TaxID=1578720 RepID=UPI0022C2394C|nr:protein hydE [Helicobacter ailurogastricus]GLH57847.1 Protein hydE [Helicobacter ailurogastricus]GLH58989.1 Protein hydE [Helicobacter ailurogastricus]